MRCVSFVYMINIYIYICIYIYIENVHTHIYIYIYIYIKLFCVSLPGICEPSAMEIDDAGPGHLVKGFILL